MRPFPRRLRHGEEATLVEHLGELRVRLFVSLGTLAAAFVVTYVFHGHLLRWLNRPLPEHLRKPATFSPIEPFATSIWVSLWAAFLLALPILFWQLWAILAPAIHFLTNYDSSHFNILIRAREYYRFVSFVLLGVALAFEVPVFVLAL